MYYKVRYLESERYSKEIDMLRNKRIKCIKVDDRILYCKLEMKENSFTSKYYLSFNNASLAVKNYYSVTIKIKLFMRKLNTQNNTKK